MILNTTKDRLLQLVAYPIIIAAFVISIAFPLVLQFTTPFTAPTAVYSQMIVLHGHLAQVTSVQPSSQNFWSSALTAENQYPIPSILLSVFTLITGISFQYAMYIPLIAMADIVFFVLARYILGSINSNQGLVWFFSSLFYLFFVVSSLEAGIVARSGLGLTFFAFFIYVYLRFACETKVPRSRSYYFGSMVILLLLIIAIGFVYYFATIDIIALMVLTIIFATLAKNAFPRKRPWFEWSILIIAVFLFFSNALIAGIIQSTSINQLFSSFIQYVGPYLAKLGIKINGLSAPTVFNINLVQFDPITNFGNRVWFFIQWSSVIPIIACIIAYRPRKFQRSPKDIVWLFCVFILFSSFGEFGYFAVGPYEPTRLLFLFGPIVTLSIVIGVNPTSNKIGKLTFDKLKFGKLKIAVAVLVILLFCVGIWGALRVSTTYEVGDAKPFTYDNVSPFAVFICTHSSNENPLVLTGDEDYAANVFFISSLDNKTASVITEPLLGDAITLNKAVTTGDSQVFVSAMQNRQIQYLLIINDGKPVYGDVWGYVINDPKPDTISQLQIALIYDDGQAQLFQVFPGSGS